jgi:membrane protein
VLWPLQVNLEGKISLLKQTYKKWDQHNCARLSASVAFYTLLSFAPLLIVLTAVVGLAESKTSADNDLIYQAKNMLGERGAEVVKTLLASAQEPSTGVFASIVSFILLLSGASGVFTELRSALNLIWDAAPQTSSAVMGVVKERLFSFGIVLSVGFLLLVSLLLSAALAFIEEFFGQMIPVPPILLDCANFIASFAVITFLFALLFKYLPAIHISWRDVTLGAIGTALLFTIGKLLLALYLGRASVTSAYGAAGSLVAFIIWVYYSAQIFFFGAEFTRVYADAHPRTPKPLTKAATA